MARAKTKTCTENLIEGERSMYGKLDYYKECIEIAAGDCGLTITPEQVEFLAGAVEGGAENIGTAFHTPDSPLIGENARLRRELSQERAKVVCKDCGGRGRIFTPGPYHSSDSQCGTCHGDGKI
jgi:hypothetical protein